MNVVCLKGVRMFRVFTTVSAASLLLLFDVRAAFPQSSKAKPLNICSKEGRVFAKARCGRGETILNLTSLVGPPGAAGNTGAAGATGATGASGADGQLRVYGDGSAGAGVFADGATLPQSGATGENLQFTSFQVAAGNTVSVLGGTIIRVAGNVAIEGTLQVQTQNRGAQVESGSGALQLNAIPAYSPPSAGIAASPAGLGEIGNNTESRVGGRGGAVATQASERVISQLQLLGGGAGAGGSPGHRGGDGGGSVMIIAQGTITISSTGVVAAAGGAAQTDSGGGGGGGGIIILASKTAVINNGAVEAPGGAGASGGAEAGSGGGGGGGLVFIAAPAVSGSGTSLASGGNGRPLRLAGQVSAPVRIGGGGGGGGLGAGGDGGTVASDGSSSEGQAGGNGSTSTLILDPTAML
jgi:hypothetical protein